MPKESVEQVMTIPLRSGWSGPRQDRAARAIKTVRKHVSKHLKNHDADGDGRTVPWKEVWIDTAINLAIWARGQQHIPHFIKVKAILFEDGEIRVELAGKDEDDDEKADKTPRGKKGAKGAKKKESEKVTAPLKKEKDDAEEKDEKKEANLEKRPAKPVAGEKPKESKKTSAPSDKKEEKKPEKKVETPVTKKSSGAGSTKSQSPKEG